MTDYFMAVCLTDSAQRFIDPADKTQVEIVKISNIPPDMLSEYSPAGLFFEKGLKATQGGLTPKLIAGDKNSITVEGFIKKGILPLPQTETYAIGDTFSGDWMWEVSSDGSKKTQASVVITEIILMKNEDDIGGLLTAIKKLSTIFSRDIKLNMAEQIEPSSATTMAAEGEESFMAEYESYMAEVGLENYPVHRLYHSNV